MSLADYLTPDRVAILSGRTKHEVLDELIALSCRCFPRIQKDVLGKAIAHRESLMSTGIGQGLAVPHARLDGVTEPMVVVGIAKDGVEGYESLDGGPIHVLLLIVAGKGQHEPYLRLLATALGVLKKPAVREAIINCPSAQDAYRALTGA
jgi:PTS system nitrogen regulatory IIA component